MAKRKSNLGIAITKSLINGKSTKIATIDGKIGEKEAEAQVMEDTSPPPAAESTSPTDPLRRSKRRKFHLDVVAAVNGKKGRNEPLSVETNSSPATSSRASTEVTPPATREISASAAASDANGSGSDDRGKRKRRSTAPYRDYGYTYAEDLEDEDMRGFIGENFCTKCPARYETKHGKNNHMKLHGGERRKYSCELCDFSASTLKAGMQHAKMHKAFGVLSAQPSPVIVVKLKDEEQDDEEDEEEEGGTQSPPPLLLPETSESEETHLATTSHEVAPTLIAQKPPVKQQQQQQQRQQQSAVKTASFSKRDRQCPHCPFLGKSATRLKRHYKGHELQRGFVCGAKGCGFKCETRGFLKRHYTLHKEQLPWPPAYVSSSDGKETKHERLLRLRPLAQIKSKFINEDNEVKCNIGDCEFSPISQQNLINHKILMHRAVSEFPKAGNKICLKCGYRAKSAILLKAHKISRHGRIENAKKNMRNRRKRTFYIKEMIGEVYFTNYVCQLVNDKNEESLLDESFDSTINTSTSTVPTETYHCNLCPYKAVSASRVERHYTKHFVENEFKCSICKYSCRSLEMMSQHERLHTENGEEINEETNESEKEAAQQKGAVNKVHDEMYKSSIMKYCEKRRLDSKTIGDSFTKITVEGQKIFKCLECPYTSKYRGDIKAHKSRHATPQGVSCTQCSYSAARPVSLRDHMKQHMSTNSKLDDGAGKKIIANGRHIANRKGNGVDRVYTCLFCPYFTSVLACVWRHSRSHRNVPRVHLCSLCSYSSIDKTKMDDHIIVHLAQEKSTVFVRRVNNEGRTIRMITDYDHDPSHAASAQSSSNASRQASPSMAKNEKFLKVKKTNSRISTPIPSSANLMQLGEPKKEEAAKIEPVDMELSHYAIRMYLRKEKKAEQMNQCPDCPYHESDLTLFRLHRDMHFNEGKPRPFECCECNFSVYTANALQAHLRLHSDGLDSETSSFLRRKNVSRKTEVIPAGAKFYQCSTCSFKTVDDLIFMEHRGEHRRVLAQKLSVIMKRSTPKDDYQKPRLKYLSANRTYKSCSRCMFRCVSNHQFIAHNDRHGWNQLYKCSMCDYSDPTKNRVDFHETHHHVTKEHTLTDTQTALNYAVTNGIIETPILRRLTTPTVPETLLKSATGLKCPICDFVAHLAPELSFHITQRHHDHQDAARFASYLQMELCPPSRSLQA